MTFKLMSEQVKAGFKVHWLFLLFFYIQLLKFEVFSYRQIMMLVAGAAGCDSSAQRANRSESPWFYALRVMVRNLCTAQLFLVFSLFETF